jgi:hypothetical protein
MNPFANPLQGTTESSGFSASGAFKFAEKRARLDWRAVEHINIDRMILETDLS